MWETGINKLKAVVQEQVYSYVCWCAAAAYTPLNVLSHSLTHLLSRLLARWCRSQSDVTRAVSDWMQIVASFADCMQKHSFHTALVVDLISWMCEKYNELIVRQCQTRIRSVSIVKSIIISIVMPIVIVFSHAMLQAIDDNPHEPLSVRLGSEGPLKDSISKHRLAANLSQQPTEYEYDDKQYQCNRFIAKNARLTCPSHRRFPFSSVVPLCCNIISKHIEGLRQYTPQGLDPAEQMIQVPTGQQR